MEGVKRNMVVVNKIIHPRAMNLIQIDQGLHLLAG